MIKKIKCAIIRGGTSKGVYILDKYLPADPKERENIILKIFGSPDKRQIDGLGGADPLTSKVAIIGPSERDDSDVYIRTAKLQLNSLWCIFEVFAETFLLE